jgi:hypothetical protein
MYDWNFSSNFVITIKAGAPTHHPTEEDRNNERMILPKHWSKLGLGTTEKSSRTPTDGLTVSLCSILLNGTYRDSVAGMMTKKKI